MSGIPDGSRLESPRTTASGCSSAEKNRSPSPGRRLLPAYKLARGICCGRCAILIHTGTLVIWLIGMPLP